MTRASGDRRLRRIRIALAVMAFIPLAAVFFDIGLLPPSVARMAPRTQLIPALLDLPVMAALVAVAAVALLTLVLGRVYCSTLCPLGTMQDVVIRLSTRRRRRRRFRFAPPVTAIHLGIAAVALGTALSAHLVLLDLLEPYSGAGRTFVVLVRPAVAGAVNALSRALAAFHVYAVAPVQMSSLPPSAMAL